MKKVLLGGISVLWLSLIPVCAQIRLPFYKNHWEFGGFVGFSHLSKGNFVTPIEGGGTQTVVLDPDNRYVAGVRITENRWEHLGAEFEYGFASHPFVFRNLKPTFPQMRVKQRVHKLAYSVLFYPRQRQERVRPFFSVGVGSSFYQVSSDSAQALAEGVDLKGRWKFAFSYGAGVKVMMGKNFGIRGGFRDHVTSIPDYGLPSVAPQGNSGAGFWPQGSFHNWQIALGMMYTFDSL